MSGETNKKVHKNRPAGIKERYKFYKSKVKTQFGNPIVRIYFGLRRSKYVLFYLHITLSP